MSSGGSAMAHTRAPGCLPVYAYQHVPARTCVSRLGGVPAKKLLNERVPLIVPRLVTIRVVVKLPAGGSASMCACVRVCVCARMCG